MSVVLLFCPPTLSNWANTIYFANNVYLSETTCFIRFTVSMINFRSNYGAFQIIALSFVLTLPESIGYFSEMQI